MVGYEQETLERLPLAESAYRLLDYVTDAGFLDDVYAKHRGRSYSKLIDFPLLVHLVADALLEHQGSGHKSFKKASEQGVLTTSLKAAYGKLARTSWFEPRPVGPGQPALAGCLPGGALGSFAPQCQRHDGADHGWQKDQACGSSAEGLASGARPCFGGQDRRGLEHEHGTGGSHEHPP